MHRLRISDEEIIIIKKGLTMLAHKVGYIQDTPEKVLIWRTYERFHSLSEADPIYKRPRRQLYHKEVVDQFKAT